MVERDKEIDMHAVYTASESLSAEQSAGPSSAFAPLSRMRPLEDGAKQALAVRFGHHAQPR